MTSSITTWFPKGLSEVEKLQRTTMILGNVERHLADEMDRLEEEGDVEGYFVVEHAERINSRLMLDLYDKPQFST